MKPIPLLSGLIVVSLLASGAAAAGCGDMYNALTPTRSPAFASSEVFFSSELQIAADDGQADFDQNVENVILQVARDMRQHPIEYGAVASLISPSVGSSEVIFSSELQIAADEGQAQSVRRRATQLPGLFSKTQITIDNTQLAYDVAIGAVWSKDIALEGSMISDSTS